MNGIIYARYSSDSQREESIEGQLRECKAFAERNGIVIVDTYAAVLFFVICSALFGDLKDERHRATVRWTVVTTSDQGDPVAANQVPSLAPVERLDTQFGQSLFFFSRCHDGQIHREYPHLKQGLTEFG